MFDDVAYVALGSNLGDRAEHLATARTHVEALDGVRDVRVSSIEETAPLGSVAQGAFLNQMMAFRTSLMPLDLLDALLEIERQGGRVRAERWGARTIDLDIVLFAKTTWNDDRLMVPHPQLPYRDFWHRELAELGAPGFTASSTSQPPSSTPV